MSERTQNSAVKSAPQQLPDEERLLRLEERIAYLEDALDKSNAFIDQLLNDCSMLKEQIKILAVRQGEISAVCDLKDETPPPHY